MFAASPEPSAPPASGLLGITPELGPDFTLLFELKGRSAPVRASRRDLSEGM
jgi:hypothetical protein